MKFQRLYHQNSSIYIDDKQQFNMMIAWFLLIQKLKLQYLDLFGFIWILYQKIEVWC